MKHRHESQHSHTEAEINESSALKRLTSRKTAAAVIAAACTFGVAGCTTGEAKGSGSAVSSHEVDSTELPPVTETDAGEAGPSATDIMPPSTDSGEIINEDEELTPEEGEKYMKSIVDNTLDYLETMAADDHEAFRASVSAGGEFHPSSMHISNHHKSGNDNIIFLDVYDGEPGYQVVVTFNDDAGNYLQCSVASKTPGAGEITSQVTSESVTVQDVISGAREVAKRPDADIVTCEVYMGGSSGNGGHSLDPGISEADMSLMIGTALDSMGLSGKI